MAYYYQTARETRSRAHIMEVIHVIDGASIVRVPDGRTVMVGAPPEAIKVLLLWGWPTPQTVVLAPDPLAAQELGGSLVASSPGPGQGATFILEIPLNPVEKAEACA